MAEVDTSIYKPNPNNQPLTLPQIFGLIGQVNQNKLQQQEIDARQGLSDVYKTGPNPDPAEIARRAGYQAGPAVQQGIVNNQAQFGLGKDYTKTTQEMIGALGSKKDLKPNDIASVVATLSRNGIPANITTPFLDEAYAIGNNPKKLGEWARNHGILALGTDALKGTAGPPLPSGQVPLIPAGRAIQEQAVEGGMPTTNPPGLEAAANAAGSRSGEAYSGATGAASDYKSQITPLTKIVHLLDMVGPTGQGIGTETTNAVKNIGVGLGLLKPDTTLPVEELKKYYTQNVLRNADIGSTDKMVSAFHGNPNIDLNTASASDLAKTDLALRRLRQAQALTLLRVPKDKYQEKAAEFNNSQDQVAYGFDMMSPENQSKYLKSLKAGTAKNPGTLEKFQNSLAIAHRLELLEKPE